MEEENIIGDKALEKKDNEKIPTLAEVRGENQNLANAIQELGFSLDDDSATILLKMKNLLKAADKKAGVDMTYGDGG